MPTFLSLGERVAACGDGACASVRRSDRGNESSLGCRPSGDGFYFLGINFTNESAFPYCRFA